MSDTPQSTDTIHTINHDDSSYDEPTAAPIAEDHGDAQTDSGHNLADKDALRLAIDKAVNDVRSQTPLAQSFTNFVTINLVANAQLASGGSAAMSFLPDDIAGGMDISGASYVNVGTLLPFYKDAVPRIAADFNHNGHQWVLDPVAAGLGTTRTAILTALKTNPPTIVRGNASEIITLDRMWNLDEWESGYSSAVTMPSNTAESNEPSTCDAADTHGVGVEAGDEVDDARTAAERLARYLKSYAPHQQAAIAVSGAVDLVTDGATTYRLPGGSELLTKITGAGCSLGGVTATYLAVSEPLVAALAASALYNRASETAQKTAHGPGTFQPAFLDALWNTSAQEVAASTILRYDRADLTR